jgi:SAM-dependent methyltransferase
MPRRLNLPDSASIAEGETGGKLFAPSAARNAEAITEALAAIAPATGPALEIASGTGQHVVGFARALPRLVWQPTEIDPVRRASIDLHVAEAALPNLRAAIALDATAPGWGAVHSGQALIVLVNLLHLISTGEARTLIAEAAQALGPGGRFALYGPFLRDGTATSEGDARFHASLVAQDPEIGYKDVADVTDWLRAAGLMPQAPRDMPANNLLLAARHCA